MDIKELAQAILDDEMLQVNLGADDWIDATARNAMSTWLPTASLVRLKPPPPTPVDLSVLVESGIDCEFTDHNGRTYLSILTRIDQYFWSDRDTFGRGGEAQCRPRMNHWHAWDGGDCPLPVGLAIEARLRSGTYGPTAVETAVWVHGGESTDIIAFRVQGLADGYCWPWEAES